MNIEKLSKYPQQRKIYRLLAGILITVAIACQPTSDDLPSLLSPNGKLGLILREVEHAGLQYCLLIEDDTLVSFSSLGLEFADQNDFTHNLNISSVNKTTVDEKLAVTFGERNSVPNQYRELTINLTKQDTPNRELSVVFRLLDEGLAFRYEIPDNGNEEDSLTLLGELTCFAFTRPFQAYYEEGHEGVYELISIDEFPGKSEIPLLIEHDNGYLILNEGALENYPRLTLSKDTTLKTTLKTSLFSSAKISLPFHTPWRIIRYASTLEEVVEENYLAYVLAPPNRIGSTDWIKPGKAMRIATEILNTDGAISVVDFASTHTLQYVELDAGWYGKGYGMQNEGDPASDPRSVISELDLPYVIDYAHKNDLKVIVYINKVGLEGYADEIFPLYKDWGIDGLKFGFVDGRTQAGIQDTHHWVKMAAKYEFVVDIHDNYRPTGMSRSYPHLLTQEGIRGNEHGPTTSHNATLPFTRFITGAGDYTICYLHDRAQGTSAHQLAMGVIGFSPLQFVYWYGTPPDYEQAIGTQFFAQLPTVWNETQFVAGAIGEYVIMARRDKDTWFLGAITNEEARTIDIPFAFLSNGETYQTEVYQDATDSDVEIQTYLIDRVSTLSFNLSANGGVAMQITPLD